MTRGAWNMGWAAVFAANAARESESQRGVKFVALELDRHRRFAAGLQEAFHYEIR